uniref:Uncharacterized protein ycf35 n=1 Tax=Compsopogon caeruleus TaxID=31354 RepID=A0A1Z1XAW2_9RHOD|nr:hypothetical protein [Compsopogon caeruleus]ARX95995.1 hypothetical protein [Compsopogon caeruleus]
MSHFSKIRTTIRDIEMLKLALNDLGLSWTTNHFLYNNYSGEFYNADLVIQQQNNSNIGFLWNGKEYELIADHQLWKQRWSIECFIEKLAQSYAYNSILFESINQGFTKLEDKSLSNGIISLKFQRWLN